MRLNFSTIIVANGEFPSHQIPLKILEKANQIICCDGAANTLIKKGFKPNKIIGDMDSINPKLLKKYKQISVVDKRDDINDLTKAVNWCEKNRIKEIAILAATGKREDHFIGNFFLLYNYIEMFESVVMLTDSGIFTPIIKTTKFESYKGQKVSIFSLQSNTKLTSENLKYPLHKRRLLNYWEGTLNESTNNYFEIKFSKGKLIIYQNY